MKTAVLILLATLTMMFDTAAIVDSIRKEWKTAAESLLIAVGLTVAGLLIG